LYVMMATALDREQGISLLTKSCETIEKIIRSKNGDLNIKIAPRAVTERDDKLLHQLMESLEKQNQEVAGDDPDEEDD